MRYERAEHIFQHRILILPVRVDDVDLFCELDQHEVAFARRGDRPCNVIPMSCRMSPRSARA